MKTFPIRSDAPPAADTACGCGSDACASPLALTDTPATSAGPGHAHGPADHDHADHDHAGHDHGGHPHGAAPAAAAFPYGAAGLRLRIPAMDCAAEESQIRAALDSVAAVQGLRFDLAARTLLVDAPEAVWPEVVQKIEAKGFATEALAQPVSVADIARQQRREMGRLGAALVAAVAAELLHFFTPDTLGWQLAGMAVAALAIALAGTAVFKKGLLALRRGQLNINALMTVAVTGAFAIGQWPEAAMVMALYSLAEVIEARAVERARNAIKGLLDLAPAEAEVRQPDGSWQRQPVAGIALGATLRVKPGERLPLDGRITAGQSAVDQAPVTGESVPVEKGPGDAVFAGTINQNGSFEFAVTAPASDTVLARIIHAVEAAQGKRAPTQRIVDQFANIYTPAVFAIAVAVAIGGPLLAGWAWGTAVYKALVLLVIACPCALVISTPVTVVSGLAAAARRGILIKGGVYLEEARRLTQLALDKTGTVTEGKPRLVAHEVLVEGADAAAVRDIAHAIAARSDHPVSMAIAQGLVEQTRQETGAVDDFAAEVGRGVRARIAGRGYALGNHRWIEERQQCSPALEARMRAQEEQGRTVTLLADDNGVLALFAVADTIKPSSQAAIGELQALGITPVMLTGDNAATAQAIAAQAGITAVRANLLPQDKLEAIRTLSAQGPVGMVGDGINDAPALAAASIGFAMGQAGTHTAVEAASVVIMNDDLRRVPETVRLSRRTHTVLWQNITLALGIKAVFLVLALADNASMWMAVFADMGASLLVVFNGLRLLRGAPGKATG
ncbi:heavy metal translocating P-type ATPase [Hydrogenophaga sp. NFH-34]|uniref:heavy metal translocating P-type ATPase n=1 Tax=Hydrogenophaga sp. NFH-34 TaxID=2744446 RepID=UPI003FA3B700